MYEAIDERGFGGPEYLRFGRSGASIGDVVADRSFEQPRVLKDHADS